MQKAFLTKMAIVSIFFLVIVMFIIAGVSFLEVKGKVAVVQAADEGTDGERRVENSGYFNNFLTWPSSVNPREPDNTRNFLTMIAFLGGNVPFGSPYQFIDINGDGLVDVIFSWESDDNDYYGVFLNNGSNEMEPTYRCVYDGGWSYQTPPSTNRWYGDCAM